MTQTRGGFGRHLSPAEVRVYRDAWVRRVESRRTQADAIIIQRMTARSRQAAIYDAPKGLSSMNTPESDLSAYIDQLPNILADAYRTARPEWDSGTNSKMKQATYKVIEVLRQMWLRLAASFPNGHFGEGGPESFIDDYIKFLYRWRYALAEPKGPGTGGTIVGLLSAGRVMHDLETATVETVEALRGYGLGQDRAAWKIWLGYWEAAKEAR